MDVKRVEDKRVEVFFWENQRYKPLQGGWQSPWTGEATARFSNDEGTVHIPFEKDELPVAVLPPGWQWIIQWQVDKSHSYGSLDNDGWSYANTFENLIECTKNRCLSSEIGRLSVVRRRRWIRYRECVTTESKKEFTERIQWIQLLSQRVNKINLEKTDELISINNFERERKVAYDKLLSTAERCLQESVSTLEGVVEKLNLMKQFLIERGKLELDYATKLKTLASKWVHAGVPKNNIPKVIEGDDQPPSNPGFFYVISASNNAVATRLQDFATLLSVSLPQDVSSVSSDVDTIHESCLKEGPKQWCVLKGKEETSLKALASFQKLLEVNRKHSLEEVSQLETELFICHAAQHKDVNSADPVVMQGTVPHECTWMAIQKYKRSVVELKANLLIYNAFAVQQKTEALKTSSRVASLLHATIKILAHEQSRLWEESAVALKTLSKSSRSRSPYNTDTSYNTASSKKIDSPSSPITIDDDDDEDIAEDSTNLEIQRETEQLNKLTFPALDQKTSIAYRGTLEYSISPPALQKKLASSRNSFAPLPPMEWKSVDVIITYDKYLHVYPLPTNEYDWIGDEPLHSISLKSYNAVPLLVPVADKDCFILQPQRNGWASKKNDIFLFLVKDSISSRTWLNAMASPYHDPNTDPPLHRLDALKLKKFVENHVDPGCSTKGIEV